MRDRLVRQARRVGLVALGMLIAACGVAYAAGAQEMFTIVADERLGFFDAKRDGTLGDVVAAFGGSSMVHRTSDTTCLTVWNGHGLAIYAYKVRGNDPCSHRFARVARAVIHGDRYWKTSEGLNMGDPVARLRQLYPNARFHHGIRGSWPAGWWLVPRDNGFGTGGSYPALLAETRRGNVWAFHVRYPRREQ